MTRRGRKRIDLDDEKLPKYVYLKKGRYVYVPYFGCGKFGKEEVLCPGDSTIKQVWRAYDALTEDGSKGTLRWLCEEYLRSSENREKHSATQKEYEKCAKQVLAASLANGRLFGDVDFKLITPGVVRRYRDKRRESAPVRANRELAFLSVVFSWALERDYVKTNPAKGVKRIKEKPRSRYIEDWEYRFVYDLASSPQYIRPAMELAFLMRLRLSEVLELSHADLMEKGVLARRTKGSKTQIVEWSTRLQSAIDAADSPAVVKSFYLLHDGKGQKIRTSTFQTAWNRLMRSAVDRGLKERFTFHDLKAKGVTDFDGDKQHAAGHRSAKVAQDYNRKPELVPSTR